MSSVTAKRSKSLTICTAAKCRHFLTAVCLLLLHLQFVQEEKGQMPNESQWKVYASHFTGAFTMSSVSVTHGDPETQRERERKKRRERKSTLTQTYTHTSTHSLAQEELERGGMRMREKRREGESE